MLTPILILYLLFIFIFHFSFTVPLKKKLENLFPFSFFFPWNNKIHIYPLSEIIITDKNVFLKLLYFET